ncbi:MAG: hypothetical protein HY660_00845 [Armatimonadetes bacterium]|nr:hypothetical protein [Armatimonadota bacterium]
MRWRLSALMLVLVAALGAAGPAAAQRSGDLVFALSGSPDTFDPHKTAATLAFQVMRSVYDTLVEPDDKGVLVPALAESWAVSPDGLTWTFTLRRGVKFHHGKELGAEDVKATFERIAAPTTRSPKRTDFVAIARVEAVDPLTARFVLREKFAPFLAALGQGWGAILPKDMIDRNHDFHGRPIGTGPFRLAEWVKDSHVRLVRFPDYFVKGQPRVTGVTFRIIPERTVKVSGLLTGEFDVVDAVDPLDLPRLQNNAQVKVQRVLTSTVNVVSMNHARRPLSDARARRALYHAIDREAIIKAVYGGYARRTGVFMEPQSPYYVDVGDPYPYNPERAKQLLNEAGLPQGFTVDLALPQPYEAHIRTGQLVQAMLGRAGVQARIRVVEWGIWLSRIYQGRDFDLTVIGHTGKLDPDGRLADFGDPDRPRNYVNYSNPKVASLIDAGRFTADPRLRQRIYAEALRKMTEDAMMVFIGVPEVFMGMRSNVRNVQMTYAIDTFDLRVAVK